MAVVAPIVAPVAGAAVQGVTQAANTAFAKYLESRLEKAKGRRNLKDFIVITGHDFDTTLHKNYFFIQKDDEKHRFEKEELKDESLSGIYPIGQKRVRLKIFCSGKVTRSQCFNPDHLSYNTSIKKKTWEPEHKQKPGLLKRFIYFIKREDPPNPKVQIKFDPPRDGNYNDFEKDIIKKNFKLMTFRDLPLMHVQGGPFIDLN